MCPLKKDTYSNLRCKSPEFHRWKFQVKGRLVIKIPAPGFQADKLETENTTIFGPPNGGGDLVRESGKSPNL